MNDNKDAFDLWWGMGGEAARFKKKSGDSFRDSLSHDP